MNKADITHHFNELIGQLRQMNKRTLVIIAALALPVVLLAIAVHSGASKNAAQQRGAMLPHMTLEQARANVRRRLAELEKMTPEQWPQEQKTHPRAPATLQEAIKNNKVRLAQLNAMTPQQWDAQFKPRPPKPQITPVPKIPARSALDVIPTPSAQSPALPPTTR